MSKFKVGEQYKVIGDCRERGNIIEITSTYSDNASYKTIKSISGQTATSSFDDDSWFGKKLEMIEQNAAPDRYELHITCNDGVTTHAVYKVNGEIKKRTQAVCNPADAFDIKVGACIACGRVFDKDVSIDGVPVDKPPQPEPQEDKPKHEYKVGDKVKFRAWDDMKNEYGLDEWGDIACDARFVGSMKHLCGTIATILHITGTSAVLKEFTASGDTCWQYSTTMLEPYTEPEQPKEPEYYSGKVVCIDNSKSIGQSFTPGKPYKIINGKIVDDNGYVRPNGSEIKALDDEWMKTWCYKFIPYLGEA